MSAASLGKGHQGNLQPPVLHSGRANLVVAPQMARVGCSDMQVAHSYGLHSAPAWKPHHAMTAGATTLCLAETKNRNCADSFLEENSASLKVLWAKENTTWSGHLHGPFVRDRYQKFTDSKGCGQSGCLATPLPAPEQNLRMARLNCHSWEPVCQPTSKQAK